MHKTQFFKIYKRCVICNQRIYFSFSQSELNKICGFLLNQIHYFTADAFKLEFWAD